MVTIPSNMLPLGTQAPDFTLLDSVSQKRVSLGDIKSPSATVVMFICNHCPYVKHVNQGMVALARDYQPKGVAFVAISANDIVAHPDDSPDKMALTAKEQGYSFPYLYDETQEVAKAYQAACTPDFYIFDGDLKCVYRGQLDDSRPRNGIPVTGKDMRAALDAHLSGQSVDPDQKPSIGCNIKWR